VHGITPDKVECFAVMCDSRHHRDDRSVGALVILCQHLAALYGGVERCSCCYKPPSSPPLSLHDVTARWWCWALPYFTWGKQKNKKKEEKFMVSPLLGSFFLGCDRSAAARAARSAAKCGGDPLKRPWLPQTFRLASKIFTSLFSPTTHSHYGQIEPIGRPAPALCEELHHR
jgi:hypothetical protein